jgi:hypothetical protein
MAASSPDMFGKFYFVKNHNITNNSTTTDAVEKNKHRLRILRIFEKN